MCESNLPALHLGAGAGFGLSGIFGIKALSCGMAADTLRTLSGALSTYSAGTEARKKALIQAANAFEEMERGIEALFLGIQNGDAMEMGRPES
jgi:hypothetical protein